MHKIINLKGGSLNSTNLIINDDIKFVRKSINTKSNREYGYVRWYSQLKKLQRFNQLFPGTVPKILGVGIEGDFAYFDLEYINGINIKTYLQDNELTDTNISTLNNKLWESFDIVHAHAYHANADSLKLYYQEEIQEKLNSALQIKVFKDFYNFGKYEYLGTTVTGFQKLESAYQKLFD